MTQLLYWFGVCMLALALAAIPFTIYAESRRRKRLKLESSPEPVRKAEPGPRDYSHVTGSKELPKKPFVCGLCGRAIEYKN